MPTILARRTVRVRRVRTITLAPPGVPCTACARDVAVLTALEAAHLLQADAQALEAMVAAGTVHAVRTVTGVTWICRDSIFRRLP